MSAIGTKRTPQSRSAMSAFGGKADIELECALGAGQPERCPLSTVTVPRLRVVASVIVARRIGLVHTSNSPDK
jgi:hypothetical protein